MFMNLYFICPHTGKRSRKLYSAGKYFLHRDAYPHAMYECQTYSKRGRMVDKVCKIMNGSDKLYEELYSKHFKTHYAGKPTKRYKQIKIGRASCRERGEKCAGEG